MKCNLLLFYLYLLGDLLLLVGVHFQVILL